MILLYGAIKILIGQGVAITIIALLTLVIIMEAMDIFQYNLARGSLMFTHKNAMLSILSALVVLSLSIWVKTTHAEEMKQGKVIGGKAKLPQGYVSQSGLTWMPINDSHKIWADANDYCTNTSINDQSGWRLPTKDELIALYNSGAMKDQGWTLSLTWSSTPGSAGGHYVVGLHDGFVLWGGDTNGHYVTCVR